MSVRAFVYPYVQLQYPLQYPTFSHLEYHERTPTRPRSQSDPFDNSWDNSSIYIDPNAPQKDRYSQCIFYTCLCHKRHPSLQ
ncbi:hypothetical protein CAEBREN_32393 [Caenorhabditis brenneri]|uniref:Uncharacterized protein n=1 Tax=Caenorhabditis brenneri TaxID=135651 RepID=G0NCA8_CAEBE|nr:hypothetical protein CAEBREN_32393 [Caenorhabditis brenneri]